MKIRRFLAILLTAAMLMVGMPAATAEEPAPEPAPEPAVVHEASEPAPAPAPAPEPPKEEPKPEPKAEPKSEAPKSEPKEEHKSEAPKSEPKEEHKSEAPKSEPKEEHKSEAPKSEPKEEHKSEAPKSEPKEEHKSEAPKSEPKEEHKSEAPKSEPKEEHKDEAPKSEPKEEHKSEAPKSEPKEEHKDEAPKSEPKEETKDEAPKSDTEKNDDAGKSEDGAEKSEDGAEKSEDGAEKDEGEQSANPEDAEKASDGEEDEAATEKEDEVEENTDLAEDEVPGETDETESEGEVPGELVEDVLPEEAAEEAMMAAQENKKTPLTIRYSGDASKVYDGNPFVPQSETFGDLTVTFKVEGDATNVGNRARIVVDAISGDAEKYEITQRPVALTITKAAITIDVTPETLADIPYDGQEHTLSVDNYTISCGSTLFSAAKVIKPTRKVKAKNVQNDPYELALTAGDFSYNDNNIDATFDVKGNAQMKIVKAAITINVTPKTLADIPYDGQEHTLSVDDYTITCDSTLFSAAKVVKPANEVKATNVQNDPYELALTADDFSYNDENINATFVVSGSVQVKIVKAAITINVTGKEDTIAYDDQNHTLEAEGNYTLSCASKLFDESKVNLDPPTPQDVKDASDVPYMLGLTAGNFSYNDDNIDATFQIVSDVTLKITNAALVIKVIGNKLEDIVYDGKGHPLAAVAGQTYTLSCNSPLFNTEYVRFTAPGPMTVTESGDYALGLSASQFGYDDGQSTTAEFQIVSDVTLKIKKAQMTITVTGSDLGTIPYDGKEHTLAAVAGETYTVSCEDGSFDGGKVVLSAPDPVTAKNAKGTPYTLGLSKDMFSYNDSNVDATFVIASDVRLTINPLPVTVTVADGVSTVKYYDGVAPTLPDGSISVSPSGNAADEIKSKLSFVCDAAANAGEYAISLSGGGQTVESATDDTGFDPNFAVAYAATKYKINPLPITVTITGSEKQVYYKGGAYELAFADAVPDSGIVPTLSETITKDRDQYATAVAAFGRSCFTWNGNPLTATNAQNDAYAMGLSKEQFSCTNSNYSATFAIASDATLKIRPLPVTVTLQDDLDLEKYYGSTADQALVAGCNAISVAVNSGVDNDEPFDTETFATAVGSIQGALTVRRETTVEDGADDYDVLLVKGEHSAPTAESDNGYDPNYLVNYAGATFTINALPITVTITGSEKQAYYKGGAYDLAFADAVPDSGIVPTLSETITENVGQYSEAVAAFDRSCFTWNGTHLTGTNAQDDAYAMGLSADQFNCTNGNYSATFVIATDATLKINPLPITVTITGSEKQVYYKGGAYDLAFNVEDTNNGIAVALSGTITENVGLYSDAVTTFNDDKRSCITWDGPHLTETNARDEAYAMGLSTDQFSCTNGNYDATFAIATDATLKIKPLPVTVTLTSSVDLDKNYGQTSDATFKDTGYTGSTYINVTVDDGVENDAPFKEEKFRVAINKSIEDVLSIWRQSKKDDAEIVVDEGVGEYAVLLKGKNGYSKASTENDSGYDSNYLVTYNGATFTITNVITTQFEQKEYDTRQATFGVTTSIEDATGVTADITIQPAANAPSFLAVALDKIVVEKVGSAKSGIACGPIGYAGEGAQWNGWQPANTVLTIAADGVVGVDRKGEPCVLNNTAVQTTVKAHKTTLSYKYASKNEFKESDGSILADEGSIVFAGPAGEYIMVVVGGKKYGPFQIGGDGTYSFKIEPAMLDSGSYGAVVTGKTKWNGYLIDSTDGNGGSNPNLTCPAVSDAVAIDSGASNSISAPGFLNRADSFKIVLAEEPGNTQPIQATVAGLPARTFDANSTQKEYTWDDFFSAWSGGPTLLAPGASLTVSYVDRVGHECSGSASAGRSTAQREITIIATPSMKRSKGKLVDMTLNLQGTAVNYEQISLTGSGGSASATASGSSAYGHTKMGKWSVPMKTVPELSLGEVAFTVNGSYVNINGSGKSKEITYRGLYQPLVVVSHVEPKDNVVYGFMDPEATVFISIEHTDNMVDAFDSKANPDMFEIGITGGDKNNGIGYFLFTYGARFQPGDIIRVWYIGSDGVKDDYVYETVVPNLEEYVETKAEVLGVSITEWDEEGDSKQAFVLPVKLSDIQANPGDYQGLPMVAFGGYEVGSFSIVAEGDKLKVTEMTVEDIDQSKGSIRFFTEKPQIADLSNGGQTVKVGKAFSIPEETDIVWIYANIPVKLADYTIASHESGITFSGQATPTTRVSENNEEWYRRFNRFQEIADEAAQN